MTTKTKQTMKVMNNDVNQTQNQTFYFQLDARGQGQDDKLDHQAEDHRRQDGHRHRRQQDQLRLDPKDQPATTRWATSSRR